MTRWLPLLLAAAALLAWWSSLAGAFVFDDRTWILQDRAIRSLADPGRLLSETSRPLLKLSLAANYAFCGLDARGYHAVNLAIHVLAGMALFGGLGDASPVGARLGSIPTRARPVRRATRELIRFASGSSAR